MYVDNKDWTDDQADPSVHRTKSPYSWVRHAVVHLIYLVHPQTSKSFCDIGYWQTCFLLYEKYRVWYVKGIKSPYFLF